MSAKPQKYFGKIMPGVVGYQENVDQVREVLISMFGMNNVFVDGIARHIWHQMAGAGTREVRCEFLEKALKNGIESYEFVLERCWSK